MEHSLVFNCFSVNIYTSQVRKSPGGKWKPYDLHLPWQISLIYRISPSKCPTFSRKLKSFCYEIFPVLHRRWRQHYHQWPWRKECYSTVMKISTRLIHITIIWLWTQSYYRIRKQADLSINFYTFSNSGFLFSSFYLLFFSQFHFK